jgi:hypothetical protein
MLLDARMRARRRRRRRRGGCLTRAAWREVNGLSARNGKSWDKDARLQRQPRGVQLEVRAAVKRGRGDGAARVAERSQRVERRIVRGVEVGCGHRMSVSSGVQNRRARLSVREQVR